MKNDKKRQIPKTANAKRHNLTPIRIVKIVFLTALLFIFLFTTKRLLTNRMALVQNEKENEELIKEVITPIENPIDDESNPNGSPSKGNINPTALTIDFPKLKSINADTKGWIIFNRNYVNNPIVKTSNNEYYLNHSFYRGVNEAGSIFMDYRNGGFEDRNVVIYGHATIDRSMFGSLTDVFSGGFFNTPGADIIYIYDESHRLLKYQIFSYYTIEAEEYYITTYFPNDTVYANFLSTISSRSFGNRGITVTTADKILTLSTCAGSAGTTRRRVIHAKRIQ